MYDLTKFVKVEGRPEDYLPVESFSPIIVASVMALMNDGYKAEEIPWVTYPMACVLESYAEGLSLREALSMNGVSYITSKLWQKENDVYKKALELIKDIQADILEDIVWSNAMTDKKATLERMFALKSRRQEYKEKSELTGDQNIQVNISIDGEEVKYTEKRVRRIDETGGEVTSEE